MLLAWMRSPQPPQNLQQVRIMLPAARRAFQTRSKIVSSPKEWREVEPGFSLLPGQTCGRCGAADNVAGRRDPSSRRR